MSLIVLFSMVECGPVMASQLQVTLSALLQVCRKCKANKPAADFPQKKSHPDGRDDYCKACHAKATAARVAARGPVKEPTVGSKASTLRVLQGLLDSFTSFDCAGVSRTSEQKTGSTAFAAVC